MEFTFKVSVTGRMEVHGFGYNYVGVNNQVVFTGPDEEHAEGCDMTNKTGYVLVKLNTSLNQDWVCIKYFSLGMHHLDAWAAVTDIELVDVRTNVHVLKVDTETVATTPANRTRTTIGVGEEVVCSIQPLLTANWSTTAGSLSSTNGSTTTFTAPDVATNATVTAEYSGCPCSVSFTVIVPTTGTVSRMTSYGIYHAGTNLSSVGFKGDFRLWPDSVSFYNIEMREGGGTAVATGIYSNENGRVHPTGPWLTVNQDNDVNCRDTVESATHPPPFIDGDFM